MILLYIIVGTFSKIYNKNTKVFTYIQWILLTNAKRNTLLLDASTDHYFMHSVNTYNDRNAKQITTWSINRSQLRTYKQWILITNEKRNELLLQASTEHDFRRALTAAITRKNLDDAFGQVLQSIDSGPIAWDIISRRGFTEYLHEHERANLAAITSK